MTKYVKCFNDELDKTKPYSVLDAGLRVIKVQKIRGTVDKCGELDSKFRYVKRHDVSERSRWHRLMMAAENFHFFPAIDVIQYKGDYYVIDGNRRTSAAIALKMEFIDANVKEYIHKEDSNALKGAMYRRRFEVQTDLKNIELNNETGYQFLLETIDNPLSGEGSSLSPNVWYTQQFLPACSEIEKSKLPGLYRDLTAADIYVLIMRFYTEFMKDGRLPVERAGSDFQILISGFMFAHKVPQKRIYRVLPFRVLSSLFFRQGRMKGKFPG
jgi:hypothetical protein